MEINRPVSPVPPLIRSNFCWVCFRSYDSIHGLSIHLSCHKQCPKCDLKFQNYKDLVSHQVFCSRRFGIKICPRRPPSRAVNQKKVKSYKCQLCEKKFKSEQVLRHHHVFKCEKRYISKSWCVKI
jgi:hypothetical protein